MVVTDLPFAYVATESDTPAEARQVQLGLCQRAGLGSDEIDCRQLSTNGVENEKRCVGDIVRKVRLRMMGEHPNPLTLFFSNHFPPVFYFYFLSLSLTHAHTSLLPCNLSFGSTPDQQSTFFPTDFACSRHGCGRSSRTGPNSWASFM